MQASAMEQGYIEEDKEKEAVLPRELNQRKKQEELLWKQKSRVRWLREGEKNTKCFHKSVIQNRQQNQIVRLQGANKKYVEEKSDPERELRNYLQGLLEEPMIDRDEASRTALETIL